MTKNGEGEKLILKNNKETKHINLTNIVEIVNVESYKRYNHNLNDILDNCFADQNFKNNYDKLYNVLDNVDPIIFFLSSDQNMDTLELIYINLYNNLPHDNKEQKLLINIAILMEMHKTTQVCNLINNINTDKKNLQEASEKFTKRRDSIMKTNNNLLEIAKDATLKELNTQQALLKQQINNNENDLLKQYQYRMQKNNYVQTIQTNYRQHLANKKKKELKIQHTAVKKYILDNLTFQNNQNNADIQNIDNQIQVKISKQDIESKKQKIGFWESIFCCCSRSTIAKQEHNQLIDRFLQRVNADNNNNITVNLDTINTINDIKQAIRNN